MLAATPVLLLLQLALLPIYLGLMLGAQSEGWSRRGRLSRRSSC